MSCACVYVGDDHDMCTLHRSKMVTARKTHKCYECNHTIWPGQKYEYVVAVWDGIFQTVKTCPDCLSIKAAMFCDGWVYGGMHEYLQEYLQEINGELNIQCLDGMTLGARIMVMKMIDEIFEEDVG